MRHAFSINGELVYYGCCYAEITPLIKIKCRIVQRDNITNEFWIELLENKYQYEQGQRYIIDKNKIL